VTVRHRPVRQHPTPASALESVSTGLAYASGLCWASTCLTAAFHPSLLADPFWAGLPFLRTDTLGIVAFAVTSVALPVSEFLRLRRPAAVPPVDAPAIWSAALALARSVSWLAAAMVGYLSLNAVTHPETLPVQATHLAPWPTEALLRVIALVAFAVAATAQRRLSAPPTRPSPTPQPEGAAPWAADRT
jgi:hypothetical protein